MTHSKRPFLMALTAMAVVLFASILSVGAAYDHSDHNRCLAERRVWDIGDALVAGFTAHASPPSDQADDRALAERFRLSNERLDVARVALLAKLGPRPACRR